MTHRRVRAVFVFLLLFLSFTEARQAQAQSKKPNILVIMGDDIGWYNTSIYNRGDMGYQTPNIDRIGKEGGMFLSVVWAAELHCGSRRIHYRAVADPHWTDKGRTTRF